MTSATLPALADIAMVPETSGVGIGAPFPAPAPSWTRYAAPGAMLPVSLVTCQVAPVDDAYWTDQPLTSTGELPLLVSSTKSFVYGAPLLPPPPYTSVMTTSGEAAFEGAASSTPAADKARLEVITRAPRRRRDRFWADMSRILTPGPVAAKVQHVNSRCAPGRHG